MSDQQLTYLVGVVSSVVGFLVAWITTRQRQEESLNATVDRRVTFILDEQKARITELKAELHQVKLIVESFRDVIQAVLLASTHCPNAADGLCPITHNVLSDKLAQAMHIGVRDVSISN